MGQMGNPIPFKSVSYPLSQLDSGIVTGFNPIRRVVMSGNLVEFTDNNFDQEALKSDLPVMVDFWAPWCAPCRMVGPIIDELANSYSGKVKVGKLNTDDNPGIASRYGIMSIPTILLFKDGQIIDRISGAVPKKIFENMLAAHA